MADTTIEANQAAALQHHNDDHHNNEESKEDLSIIGTHEASHATVQPQYSHLFPAHLYVKKRTGG